MNTVNHNQATPVVRLRAKAFQYMKNPNFIAIISLTIFIFSIISYFFLYYCSGDQAFGLISAFFTTNAFIFACIVAYMQWLQSKASDKILAKIEEKVFEDIKENLSEILDFAIKITEECQKHSGQKSTLSFGIQTHFFGAIYKPTRIANKHEKLRDLVQDHIKKNTHVSICALPWYQGTDTYPLLDILNKVSQSNQEILHTDLKENFKDEISYLKNIISSQLQCKYYEETGKLNLELLWNMRAPIGWILWNNQGGPRNGMIFTYAGKNDTSDGIQNVDELVVGVTISFLAWNLITRIEDIFKKPVVNLFEKAEPRLLEMALATCLHKIDEPIMCEFNNVNAKKILEDFKDYLGTSHRLRKFSLTDNQIRYFYCWECDTPKRIIVVIPSASGLYSYWKDNNDNHNSSNARFKRYDKICKDLHDKCCNANVFLLSQAGQAGYGEWSPKQAEIELEAFLECDVIKNQSQSIYLFGICTGALAALRVVPKLSRDLTDRIKGVAIWDLAPDPGFKIKCRKLIEEKYKNTLKVSQNNSDFLTGDLPSLTAANACGEIIANFWVGGEQNSGMYESYPADNTSRTRPLSHIEQVANQFKERTLFHAKNSIGHVPGGQSNDYNEFITSLKDWINQ